MIVKPFWHMPGYTPKFAIGNKEGYQFPHEMKCMIERLFDTICCTQFVPVQVLVNIGTHIPKKQLPHFNEVDAASSLRSIHMYTSFAQSFMRALECVAKRDEAHYSAFGSIRGKRREEAVGIQLLNAERSAASFRS